MRQRKRERGGQAGVDGGGAEPGKPRVAAQVRYEARLS